VLSQLLKPTGFGLYAGPLKRPVGDCPLATPVTVSGASVGEREFAAECETTQPSDVIELTAYRIRCAALREHARCPLIQDVLLARRWQTS